MQPATYLSFISLLLSSLLGGCGPLHSPMPVRLDVEQQLRVDDAWNNALAPIGRLNNQALLDALIGTQAYQSGVDVLMFRSEKKYAAGLVVMEIQFDRQQPTADRFTVTLHDHAGRVVRQERYDREQIESTCNVLLLELPQLEQKQQRGMLTDAESQRLTELQQRAAVYQELFPKSD